ncbi:MAG: hypothetical protein KJ614_00090 [Gammaproteobacteria bacterium]|uniref:hypothetical protein n=1 Tax=Rhodoferax sp. TaxID=50421 RepID=UPI0017B0D4BC|nr:hypothetical protein [Rhodoferax sp.]MBU3897324.1 hypothetical protein [Gammaproteobacteria bacterium]MBA3057227.1 hypothetical protein [Rhodoferax sp.]MBU3998292.1 hypothetical protein [Gammaproteobacteria bacterium]MBU4018670.1 hypothetical protein [Gammaproteobacteria bacterium]MBU4079625.1 hypothetical protein [Gammaproteobacteria bacterium]
MHLIGKHQRLANGLQDALRGLDDDAILTYFRFIVWLDERYTSAYELQGPIYLVLDNRLIQAFRARR